MSRPAVLTGLVITLVSIFFVAMGISLAERVRFLRLKSENLHDSFPENPPSPEDEKRWLRAVGDHVRAMNKAGTNADLALAVGLVSGVAFLLLIFLFPKPATKSLTEPSSRND
jgi:hypothetical protein